MLDRTIPFFNTILKCENYTLEENVLPDGFYIVSYRDDYEKYWAKLEYAVGDFDSIKEAEEYFCTKYLIKDHLEDILFVVEENTNKVVGSCIAWTDEREGKPINSLHWLVVDENYQGKKLGRALCKAIMNLFYIKNGEPIYIHTQPWSWKAILLYSSLGFHLQKSDTFNNYTNEYIFAIETLKSILTKEQIKVIEDFADK